MIKNHLNIPAGTYNAFGQKDHTIKKGLTGTDINLINQQDQTPHRVWTSVDKQSCGFYRCGTFPCPVNKNMSSFRDGVVLQVAADGDAYFVQDGDRVCDTTCNTTRNVCGLDLIIVEP